MRTVAERIDDGRALTPAERRVARVVVDDPEVVAFGTVADLARRAGASGATVVRLADRLGFRGFVGLQTAVQEELAVRLRPATERIRQPAAGDVVARTLAVEVDNVHRTLDGVDSNDFADAVTLLARRRSSVFVISGEAIGGVAAMLAGELGMLRAGVRLATGNPVAVAGALAHIEERDVLVALDLRRYDRWVVDTVDRVLRVGASVVAVTDSRLSPLAAGASVAFVVSAEGAGPFDSHVGMLAFANALVNGVAWRLRATATERIDRLEAAWRSSGALTSE